MAPQIGAESVLGDAKRVIVTGEAGVGAGGAADVLAGGFAELSDGPQAVSRNSDRAMAAAANKLPGFLMQAVWRIFVVRSGGGQWIKKANYCFTMSLFRNISELEILCKLSK